MGACCKELIAESPFKSISDNFLAFPAGNRFCICSGNRLPLLTDSGNWCTATNLFELQRETYSRYQHNRGKPPLSVICNRCPIELDKPHILTFAAETGFLLFKEQVPLKFKKEISEVQCKRKTFG